MTKQRLIVFFIPPKKIINGGILSIFSICKTSRQFKNIHKSEVVLATYPGSQSYERNDLFKNDEVIYSFDQLVTKGTPQSLQLHVPEYASYDVFLRLKKYSQYLKAIPELSINIMNQNILLLQKPVEVANWFLLTPEVTQTTAHNRYATQELADLYNLPTHHLSTFVDASQYKWVAFEKKKNFIGLSMDATPQRESIVKKLEEQFPDYKIVTVKNMTYEEYKDFIAAAKFTVTFGEGFDGYYVEGFFTGGITFAVYNDKFFPDKEFSQFDNTYTSYDDMLRNLPKDIRSLSQNKKLYEKIVNKNLSKINQFYSSSKYTENIKNFYLQKFTYTPHKYSAEKLIARILTARDELMDARQKLLEEKEAAIQEQGKMLAEKEAAIQEQGKMLEKILNSRSWKVTQPLRKVSASLRKKS